MTFNGVPATGLVISQGGNTITGVTPAGAAGNATVQISTAGGTTTVPGGFTYIPPVQPPTASSINPASGSTAGGTSFTITGTNLTGATSVTFNGVSVPVTVGAGGTTVTGVTPAGAAGNATVVVNTPNGNAPLAGGFTYIPPVQPPTASSINPASGSTAGGTSFTITGTNLTGATSVTFNGVSVPVTVGAGGTTVTGVTPAGAAGNATVVVNTPNGNAPLAGGFTYIPPVQPPTASSINPASGSTAGGTSFTITGTNLTGANVTFNGAPATNVVVAPGGTSLTGITPAGTVGNAAVLVTVPGAGSALVSGGYTYTAPAPPPTVTGLSPASGSTAGGTSFTITGTNLTGANVTFNGAPATNVVVAPGGTSLTGITPAGTVGNAAVLVTVPGAGSALVSGGYTYTVPVPTVGAITPVRGSTGGGTSFTITGTNLTGATSVTFNGVPATNLIVAPGGNSLTGVTPAGTAGVATVVVNTPGGPATVSGGFTYEVPPPPTATGINPATVSTLGGTAFTLTGTNLTGATSVTFNGVPANNIVVAANGNSLTGVAPAGTAGTATVVVNTPGGPATLPTVVTYAVPLPTVSNPLVPAFGNYVGGNTVLINGTNFTNATSVTFGGQSATFNVVNANQILAVAPAGTGIVPVRVTTPGGTSTAAVNYTYAPILSSVAPAIGSGSGGTVVTLFGANFTGTTSVTFGGTNATSFTIISDNTIQAVAPAGSGAAPVQVTSPGGSSAAIAFSYAPTLASVVPATGSGTGGNTVTLNGSNFTGTTSVTFGGTNATSFTVISDTQILAVAPAGTGVVPVRVTTPGGTSGPINYSYLPNITSLSPNFGPSTGGTTVTINGTNLTGTSSVKFGGTNATSFTVISDTVIQAVAPAGTGIAQVNITAPGGTSNNLPYSYGLLLSTVTPPSGSEGTVVTITGGNLSGATSVKFGGADATSFQVVSDTQIVAVAPAGVGSVPITVSGAGGTSNSLPFSYAPLLASLFPTSGAEGTAVIINGSNLAGATSVTFGGISVPFTVVNDTQIQVVAPAGTGDVAVQVGSSGGNSNTLQFSYKPTLTALLPANGSYLGGTAVTINGSNLTGATSVTFGGIPASFNVLSDHQIVAVAPAGSGTVPVRVDAQGSTSNPLDFSYAPLLTSLSPASGSVAGGTLVTLFGSGFTGASSVTFGTSSATSFQVVSDTQITAVAPAGTGIVSVQVATPGGTSKPLSFSYAPVPTSVTPAVGPYTGGTAVIISGSGFTGATSVSFGPNAATSYTVDSDTQITAIVPAGTGRVPVQVSTPGGPSVPGTVFFSYAPVINSLSPTSGGNGTRITLLGNNFTGANSVFIWSGRAQDPRLQATFEVIDDNHIVAVSPARPPSYPHTSSVYVVSPGGTSNGVRFDILY